MALQTKTKPPTEDRAELATELVAKIGKRRRWPMLVLGLALGAGATYGILGYLDTADGGEDTANGGEGTAGEESVELTTAPVEVRDLLEEVEWTGTLLYGEPVTIGATSTAGGTSTSTSTSGGAVGGTITGATALGTEIARGNTVAMVDGEPVVAIYGQRPLWRDLEEGIEGPDVLMLEANLVALGYDQDVTVSVDSEFTGNTELMVERWQEDLGMAVTGIVGISDVVVLPGPGVLTTEAVVGATASGDLATVSPERSTTDITSQLDGIITDVAPLLTEVVHGTVLFAIDGVPVVAVSEAGIAEDSVLGQLTSQTFTNLELEQALATDLFDPDEQMTVDGVITDATSAAITRWQTEAGLPVTGVADPAYYQPITEGQTVEEHLYDDGVSAMRPVLVTSASELRVEVVVGVADADEFVFGQSVDITLADETEVKGTVFDIGPVTRANQQADPTVTITIEVVADGDTELVEGNVTVTTISEAIEGATAVPTRGLVSLAEGGFAVELANDDGSTSLVGIEIGAFDDGYVEVTSGNISPGAEIVVPR